MRLFSQPNGSHFFNMRSLRQLLRDPPHAQSYRDGHCLVASSETFQLFLTSVKNTNITTASESAIIAPLFNNATQYKRLRFDRDQAAGNKPVNIRVTQNLTVDNQQNLGINHTNELVIFGSNEKQLFLKIKFQPSDPFIWHLSDDFVPIFVSPTSIEISRLDSYCDCLLRLNIESVEQRSRLIEVLIKLSKTDFFSVRWKAAQQLARIDGKLGIDTLKLFVTDSDVYLADKARTALRAIGVTHD